MYYNKQHTMKHYIKTIVQRNFNNEEPFAFSKFTKRSFVFAEYSLGRDEIWADSYSMLK